jgi:hypothetical protein
MATDWDKSGTDSHYRIVNAVYRQILCALQRKTTVILNKSMSENHI